jgi:hypothetical protein
MKLNYLRNCLLDGQFPTENVTEFWSVSMPDPTRDGVPVLVGEKLMVGSDVSCQPLRLVNNALLVCLRDSKGCNWYSWIHADQ